MAKAGEDWVLVPGNERDIEAVARHCRRIVTRRALVAATGTVTTPYAVDVVAFGVVTWAMLRLPSLPPDGGHPTGQFHDGLTR